MSAERSVSGVARAICACGLVESIEVYAPALVAVVAAHLNDAASACSQCKQRLTYQIVTEEDSR